MKEINTLNTTQNLLSFIAGKYRLPASGRLIRLTGGERNIICKISDLDLVIRVYQPTAPLDGIEFEHRLMSLLSQRMSCIVRPLACVSGKTYALWDEHPVAVLPYLSGRTATGEDRKNPAFCYDAGNILGQMHSIAREHAGDLPVLRSRTPFTETDAYSNHLYDWETARKWLLHTRFAPEIPYIADQIEWMRGFIGEQRNNGLPLIPIHGDYYKGNLLVDGGRISGVIDFDDARMEWAEFETARALWEFARDDGPLVIDRERQEAFLSGYSAACPDSRHDLPLYMRIIKSVRLIEILATATSMINGDLLGGWDEEGEEYHWRNLLWCKKM